MQITVQQWMNSPEESDAYKPFHFEGDINVGPGRFDAKENVFKMLFRAAA